MHDSATGIELVAFSQLPTRFGKFMLYGFRDPQAEQDISMIAMPTLEALAERGGTQSAPPRS